jgi:enoyl-CoA hydratase/carnithine racemase
VTIDVSIRDWVARVEVPDYGPLSRHDQAFARQLRDVVVDLSDSDDVKAIVLACAGRDFAPAGLPPTRPVHDVLTTWHRDFAASTALYQAICFAKKVIITEVPGECSDAGSLLVLCSDLTVAAESARLGSPFTHLPEANFVLAALTIRLNRAKAWMLQGSVIPAEEAEGIGLVNRVVPSGELRAETEALALSVTGMPLDGVTMSKMLLQAVLDGQGVGREFDMADHYAIHLWTDGARASGEGRP